jgi:hypothetical protein
MPVPSPLVDWISGARSMIGRLSGIDADQLAHNSKVSLDTARKYVRPTGASDQAFGEAIQCIDHLRRQVSDHLSLSERERDVIEDARRDALAAIDQLEATLADARPSDLADALGMGWFGSP